MSELTEKVWSVITSISIVEKNLTFHEAWHLMITLDQDKSKDISFRSGLAIVTDEAAGRMTYKKNSIVAG